MRKFDSDEMVIASHNAGKVREISALLSPYISKFYSAGDLDLPEPEETEDTFEGNAALKAVAAARASGKPALADDSGLCVNALGGDPGIYSARWASVSAKALPDKGEGKDFNVAMEKVRVEIGDTADRSAYFVCVLALAWPDGHVEHYRGEVHGTLDFPARGEKGFGYDPIFVPEGHAVTFAEMEPADKHAMSHRARAFEKLMKSCFETTNEHK